MIEYNYEVDFRLERETKFSDWISRIIEFENCLLGEISYIFCDDMYLLEINKRYLEHDTFTDIITFDYTAGQVISGDIFISLDRVRDNANEYEVEFTDELLRVMSHGILHLIGYNDKSEGEVKVMRERESTMIGLFHVEH